MSNTDNVSGVSVKVAGALSGAVYVDSLDSPVQALRQEVARLLGVADAAIIKLILSGKNLQDGLSLSACGIGPNSRVLVTRGAASGAQVNAEAEKQERLERIRRVVQGLVGSEGRGSEDRYELSLENQSGSSVRFQPEDQKALVMGLTMHERGKASMAQENYSSALDELLLAEESFSLCNPSLLAGIDNVGMLLLDIVWCAYQLQDGRRLAVCRDRLVKARDSLHKAYGPNLERARKLHGSDFCPELATFARLEVMEGVVAYYARDLQGAAASLASAQAKLASLQVSDQQLVALQEMGYKLKESKRALRFSSHNIDAAVQFIEQQRARKEERKARRERATQWAKERVRYGRTGSGVYVAVEPFDTLCGMGYDRALVAEALRQSDNNATAALEALLDPARQAALALAAALASAVAQDPSMGASTSSLLSERERSLAAQLAESMAQTMQAEAAAGPATPGAAAAAAGLEQGGTSMAGAAAAAAAAGAEGEAMEVAAAEVQEAGAAAAWSEQDAEMEQEIVQGVRRGQDPMDAYDVDLDKEAEIVNTFLALLSSEEQRKL